MGITCIVTGDIVEVNGYANWICERSRPVGMQMHTPLWERDRNALLRQLLDRGFKARLSSVKTRWLDESWIGRELNDSAIAELRIIREKTGLDLCVEDGEYHRFVTDGPLFKQVIDIRSYSKRVSGSLVYMEIHQAELF